jgi:putative DNA primase/helicase
MLGEYSAQAVPELLMARTHEPHPTERADLHGKRLVATIEVDQGKRIAESLLKSLTGGDAIKARRMREDFWEFSPTHKLLLAANHKPVVRGTDKAIWRRIKLIPFTITIPDEEKDPALLDKLKAELPGILAWAVRGCLSWQRDGIGHPDEVEKATAEYREEQDNVGAFLAECCVMEQQVLVQSSVIYDAYVKWSGDKHMTRTDFAERLKSKGLESKHKRTGTFWLGTRLRPEHPFDQHERGKRDDL